jgi:hypothetical protein
MTRDHKKFRRPSREANSRDLEVLARTRDRRFTVGLWFTTMLLTTVIIASLVFQFRTSSHAHIPVFLVAADLGCLGLAIIMTMVTRLGKK